MNQNKKSNIKSPEKVQYRDLFGNKKIIVVILIFVVFIFSSLFIIAGFYIGKSNYVHVAEDVPEGASLSKIIDWIQLGVWYWDKDEMRLKREYVDAIVEFQDYRIANITPNVDSSNVINLQITNWSIYIDSQFLTYRREESYSYILFGQRGIPTSFQGQEYDEIERGDILPAIIEGSSNYNSLLLVIIHEQNS
ncbi:MAG: hypothetical protein GF308_22255 [Candidatus Heimdallarchaeota archaeon]|nr:hypothetical protein [Candidatus Heimdallarchaeota archaeon]